MNRLFFAVDINANDKKTIAHWRDNEFKQPFKAIACDNFHITLAFLGNTSRAQQQQLISDANKLAKCIFPLNDPQLLLDHLGLFKKPKVLYLGLQTCPCWLNDLANNLSQAAINIGLFQENRTYSPHLSLYRNASAIDDDSLEIAMTDKTIPLKINSFSLYQSVSSKQGVIYTPINTWQLTSKKTKLIHLTLF